MIKNKIGLIILLAILYSCNGKKEDRSAVNVLKDDVMKIHDDAMEHMEEIYALQSELQEKLKSNPDSAQREIYLQNLSELKTADSLMWDWMHNFKMKIVDTSTAERATKYLNGELNKVKKVEKSINKSIDNAKKTLSAH